MVVQVPSPVQAPSRRQQQTAAETPTNGGPSRTRARMEDQAAREHEHPSVGTDTLMQPASPPHILYFIPSCGFGFTQWCQQSRVGMCFLRAQSTEGAVGAKHVSNPKKTNIVLTPRCIHGSFFRCAAKGLMRAIVLPPSRIGIAPTTLWPRPLVTPPPTLSHPDPQRNCGRALKEAGQRESQETIIHVGQHEDTSRKADLSLQHAAPTPGSVALATSP